MSTPIEKRMKPSWMAQVSAPHQYVMDYLDKNAVGYKMDSVDPSSCKPLQELVDTNKVNFFKSAIDNDQPLEPVYLGADDEILDGHHRAFSFIQHPDVEKMMVIKIYLEGKDAMRLLNQIQDRYDFEREMGSNQLQPMGMVPFSATDNGIAGPTQIVAEEDEELPAEEPEAKTAEPAGERFVKYETAAKNKQTLTLYKAKPLNTTAKTGDFLLLVQKPGFDIEYTIEFENLLTIPDNKIKNTDLPTEDLLGEWMADADLKKNASERGLVYPVYLSREVNRMAGQSGIDGIQYGSLFVQVINKSY